LASTFAGSYLAQDHFVAVDCETTGINPDRDVITEIAIVVFGREGIVERYSQCINPGRKLPLEVVRLTGITDEDLKDAPPIQDVVPDNR
jgi:DNA polymerase-3 subunit alpha (Gram-positive type)